MKLLIVITLLTASLWSNFSYSDSESTYMVTYKIGSPTSRLTNYTSEFDFEPSKNNIVTNCKTFHPACIRQYFIENVSIYRKSDGQAPPWGHNGHIHQFRMTNPNRTYILSIDHSSLTTAPETVSCLSFEGSIISERHSTDENYCAEIADTGGTNPEPLLCMASCLVGGVCIGTGDPISYQHVVTSQSCSAATGPDGGSGDDGDDGDGDGGDGCTENCDGDDGDGSADDPDSGQTPPTSGNPTQVQVHVGGTFTDSTGAITSVNLTMDQDYSPITSRQDETNQRLASMQDRLQSTQSDMNQGFQGVISAIDGISLDGTGSSTDVSGIEFKLDTMQQGFDNEALGNAASEGLNFGDPQTIIDDVFDSVTLGIDNADSSNTTGQLENIGDRVGSFESIPALFDYAAVSCSPMDFGSQTLDLCPYAATTSNLLTYIATILTILFLVTSLYSDLTRMRAS